MSPAAPPFVLMRLALLLGLVVLSGSVASAQEAPSYEVHPDYTVRHWTVQDGLPSNTINDIFQTSDGYLWLATIEGVVRFDGQHFTVYNATNTPALSSNRIHQLVEGPPGHLWIRSEPGRLVRYHNGVFTRVAVEDDALSVSAILYVEGDTVWVKLGEGEGLAHYGEGRMRSYRPDVLQQEVMAMVRDGASRLWVGTFGAGIYRFDPDGTVRHFTADDGLPPLVVQSLLLDRDDGLWVVVEDSLAGIIGDRAEGGLARIVGDRVEVIPHPRGRWPTEMRMSHLDAEGGVWVSAGREGWWRFDPSGARTLVAPSTPSKRAGAMMPGPDGRRWRVEERSASSTARFGGLIFRDDEVIFGAKSVVTKTAFDRRGGLWVGTLTQGLYRLHRAALHPLSVAEGLPNGNIYPILEDRQRQIWVGTFGDGVVRLDATLSPSWITPEGNILSLYEDQDGTIWVGGFGATCRIENNRCLPLDIPLPRRQNRGVRAMYNDRRDRLWLGGHNGLAVGRGDGAGRRWTAVVSEDGLPAHMVRAIMETRDAAVLFATQGDGVLRYDEDGGFEALTTDDGLASNNVRDIYEDHEGFLWVVLEDRGLCRLDRQGRLALKGGDLACIDTRDGLHWDGLHRLLEDDQGRFWFNSNYGIFWIERAALQAYFAGELSRVVSVSYTEADGLRNREGNGGMQPAGIKASDGRLWFPTQDGVVIVDPNEVSTPASRVFVEGIEVGEAARPLADRLVLHPSERDVLFRYTALEYVWPDDVRFQYRLAGYDGAWREAGSQREVSYTNLPSGSFTFEVRGGIGGQWGEAATVMVERSPFFWQTWWFLLVCGLAVAAGGYGLYRVRLRQVEAGTRELEQVVEARTEELRHANALKSRFLANISHEFRTPLTLTFGPLDDLANRRFSSIDEALPHIERARRNGSRLLRLINQLLDLSKLDAGALVLQHGHHDLARHLRQIAALFDSMAEAKRLHYAMQVPDEPLLHVFDADKIEKVVVNLLSNAFKFTPSGGKVSLTLAQEADGAARIEVADTGSGIAEEHLEHLFDRFYQVEGSSTRRHEGTGIGLALAKELVELHEGTIAVESTVGFGTRFTVRLPQLERGEKTLAVPEETILEASQEEPGDAAILKATLAAAVAAPMTVTAVPEEATVVLIVEDNADMRAYIRAHLEDRFTPVEAENGKVGLERARELVPDLVLSDVMMPEMDGLDLCQALKQDTTTSHIPVVLLTAKAQVEHRIAGFESGADAYLPKPFNAEELTVRVRTLVEERRRLQARFAGTATPQHDPVDSQAEVAALPPREVAFLEELEALVHRRMTDPQFGTEALAEDLGMALHQLRRKLRALLDETPVALMRRLRLAHAAALLAEGGLSVKEVMYAVGFSSDSSFGRAFRQVYGTPPSEYAERQAKRP